MNADYLNTCWRSASNTPWKRAIILITAPVWVVFLAIIATIFLVFLVIIATFLLLVNAVWDHFLLPVITWTTTGKWPEGPT